MEGRIGRLLGYFRRAEPGEAAPSAWALTFDAAVAVGAAAGAVYEMATRTVMQEFVVPGVQVAPALRSVIGEAAVHPVRTMFIAAALTGLPLAARRIYPVCVFLVIAIAIVVAHSFYVPPVALGTAVYAAYSAVTHSKYRNLAIATVVLVTIAVAMAIGDALPRSPGRLTAIFAIVPAAAAGLGIRELRRRLADSTARLRRAAAEAKAATEKALAAERSRIASELHDVVTHNVSVMIVQAGAARKILATSPSDAEDALLAVEATGREAMTELRNLLGLLSPRAGDPAGGGVSSAGAGRAAGAAALRPQPGLGELDALIGRVAAAGLPVELRVSGEPRPLSPGAGLAAYRVVQEGLTNVLRHAGRAAATVDVEWGERLVITVSDDGDGGAGSAGAGSNSALSNSALSNSALSNGGTPGRGLLGLRERLALYDGELTAGPRPAGGWQLRADIPAGTAS